MNKWLININRFSAWVLFASMLLFFITGYGMTKGIISREFSADIHLGISPVIIIAFTLHTAFAIRLAFIRWDVWNKGTMALLIAFYLAFLGVFIYLDQWYLKEAEEPETAFENLTTTEPASALRERVFTESELAKYNGKNGMPAYVAVDGVVYDVSSVFTSGSHYSHFAGKELTDAFYIVHVKSEITKYPVVGNLR